MRQLLACGLWGFFALGVAPLLATAQPSRGSDLAFVTCPVARHQGPYRDVCFIVRHKGVEYGIRGPEDWGEPQLKHQLLVEAKVTEGELCGATALQGRFSVLPEVDNRCNEIIPYTGPVDAPPEGGRNFMSRVSNDPRWQHLHPSVRPVESGITVPELAIEPPYKPQQQVIYFPFNSDRSSGPDMGLLASLVGYAIAADADFRISSFTGNTLLDSGEVMAEKPGVAQQRAEKMRSVVVGLGLDPARLDVFWQEEPFPEDGVEDWRGRRVEIFLEP